MNVDDQISRYAAALDALDQATDTQSENAILCMLTARDKVAAALDDKDEAASPDAVNLLTTTDQRLTKLAVKIDTAVGGKLSTWRHSRNPDEHAWWWKLDELAVAVNRKRIWTLIAAFLLAVSVVFVVDTFNLLRTVGENVIGSVGVIVQAVLTLIVASAFTEAGRQKLVDAFSRIPFKHGKNRKFEGVSRTALAALVLAITLLIRIGLPAALAFYFRWEGDRFLSEGLVQTAIPAYQQAMRLQPYSIRIHLALAKASEKASDYDQAIAEYQSTIVLYERGRERLDDAYYETKNNLARLLILQRKDYSAVQRILDRPDEMIAAVTQPNRRSFAYYLWTYKGWAELELSNYNQAAGDLKAALAQRTDGAAAHYLLGRALEGQKNLAAARDQWSEFINILQSDLKQTEDVPPNWRSYAQERLLSQEVKDAKNNP